MKIEELENIKDWLEQIKLEYGDIKLSNAIILINQTLQNEKYKIEE